MSKWNRRQNITSLICLVCHEYVVWGVYLVPPSIELSDRLIVVTERHTAQLPCVAEGFPQPTISWIKDGRMSLDSAVDSRYDLLSSGGLRISHVQVVCAYHIFTSSQYTHYKKLITR